MVRSLLGCQTTSKELRAAGGRKVTNIEGKCSVEYFLDKTVATTWRCLSVVSNSLSKNRAEHSERWFRSRRLVAACLPVYAFFLFVVARLLFIHKRRDDILLLQTTSNLRYFWQTLLLNTVYAFPATIAFSCWSVRLGYWCEMMVTEESGSLSRLSPSHAPSHVTQLSTISSALCLVTQDSAGRRKRQYTDTEADSPGRFATTSQHLPENNSCESLNSKSCSLRSLSSVNNSLLQQWRCSDLRGLVSTLLTLADHFFSYELYILNSACWGDAQTRICAKVSVLWKTWCEKRNHTIFIMHSTVQC